jgi:hypothetical protein
LLRKNRKAPYTPQKMTAETTMSAVLGTESLNRLTVYVVPTNTRVAAAA